MDTSTAPCPRCGTDPEDWTMLLALLTFIVLYDPEKENVGMEG